MTKPYPTDRSTLHEKEGRLRGLISALPDLDVYKAARMALAMQSATTEQLKAEYLKRVAGLSEKGALALGVELSMRGVAPCFRDIPYDPWFKNNIEVDCILAKCDLQWIAVRYPNHLPQWQRVQGIFDPSKFARTAEYLIWNGQRSPGYLSKALALTDSQQRECRLIQCLHVSRWRERLLKRRPLMEARITGFVRSTDQRDATSQDETIHRRKDLWLCGEMANWKPQRTADLYSMKTGLVLARNVVDNQLVKIRASCRSHNKYHPN